MEVNPLLGKRDNESDFDYHKRLVYGKLVDKTLADLDYTELAPYVYNQEYSGDVARRMMYGSARTLQLLDSEQVANSCDGEDMQDEIERKILELKMERQKFFDQRAALTKVIRDRSRQEELNEIISSSITAGIKLGSLEDFGKHETKKKAGDNDLIVTLNDIHYGLVVDNYWGKYNPDICKELLEKYAAEIIEIATTHNSQNCYVVGCGDFISGNIHQTIQIQNRENAIEQVKGVSELISRFLMTLGRYFESVKCVNVAGNHSRLSTKEDSPKDERLDDLIEWYLRARLAGFNNIVFDECEKIDETINMFEVRGKLFAAVHGDYDSSDSKINSLRAMCPQDLYGVILGHLHHNKVDTVNGIKTIMGGTFVGMDDYCVQKRIVGKPSQLVCVCSKDGVKPFYDIEF